MKLVSPVKEKPCHDLILQAAQELLREHGYKRMTMDEVAARANLGKGTLYLYFDNKEDLALSCIDQKHAMLRSKLKAIARSSLSVAEKLETMLRDRVLVRLKSVQGYKTGIDDLLFALRQQLFERREVYHHQEALLFAEVLVEGRTTGEFDVDEPYETAQALITATNALLPYSLSPKELVEKARVQQSIDRLAPMLVRSLRKYPQSANANCGDAIESD